MKKITDYETHALRGKRVLVRVGFDVPVDQGRVLNDFRIRESLETINFLCNAGARVILISHIGRDKHETLRPVHAALSAYVPAQFIPSLIGEEVSSRINALTNGEVVLLENLRGHDGEAQNDDTLARTLASYADLYVNEAFSVAHRAHASIVGVPKYVESSAGIGFAREVSELQLAFSPSHPAIFVIGGAKFDTKLPLVKKFMTLYDHLFICGALAHDVMVARGIEVGGSLVSEVPLEDQDIIRAEKIVTPRDVRVYALSGSTRVTASRSVLTNESIMDAGPESIEHMLSLATPGSTVLWNGPLGWYERGFVDGTEAFARGLAEKKSVRVIVGGGDTVASIEKLGLNDTFTHVSTAGGAMLEFLEKGTLLGIDALTT
jgi:phosphoglycerate kinase